MSTPDFNAFFRLAAGFVQHTSKHVFLTGKAGTGKTTFLKYLKENSFKNIAVVAPTGVAAINAGGVTLHSFFQLPLGVYLPTKSPVFDTSIEANNEHSLFRNLRLNRSKRQVLKELELLVIDEISMVRADMLDAVDIILRHVRQAPNLPFGGLQVLYIGDLYQLPPVAIQKEWQLLKEYYKSPFFFDALVVQQCPPVYIELKKIYRQNDQGFIELLNNIRNNRATAEDLELLHRHYNPTFVPPKEDNYITLTSHNAKADAINRRELQKLPGKTYTFEGEVTGEFYDKSFPADKTLHLKEGAQVMFIKNDKGEHRRYFNGKIGIIKSISKEGITVSFPGEEDELQVEKETWRNIRYNYSPESDSVEEEELGSFTQYPIRLAWAITIHKSQGLTFDKAIIDAGEAFAAGQVYVALSRLTALDGLVLYSRIQPHSIRTDERILAFAQSEQSEETLQELLQQEQKAFISQALLATFNLTKLTEALESHLESYAHRNIPNEAEAYEWAEGLLQKAKEQQQVGQRFMQQLEQLLASAEQDNFNRLHQRIEAAAQYFVKALDEQLLQPIQQHAAAWRAKSKSKKYNKDLETLKALVERRKFQIQHAVHLAKGLTQGLDAVALLQIVEEQRRKTMAVAEAVAEKPKTEKGQTRLLSLQLFRSGKSIPEIAAERNLTVSTIEGHLASYIESGAIDVTEIVAEHKIIPILAAIEKAEPKTLGTIKANLGPEYSYGEIKAVMSYQLLQEAQRS